jgi:HAD superfamily hydrolase (TIGR01509 family)
MANRLDSPGEPSFEVFIFDFDGVITYLGVNWKAVEKEVQNSLGIKINGFLDFFDSSWMTPEFQSVSEIVQKYEIEAVEKREIYPDVLPTLKYLSDHDRSSYIASMQSRVALETFLNRYKLQKFFKKAIAREDAGNKKRELEIILSLEPKVPRDRIVFIDDSKRHMASGKDLGLKCIQFDRTKPDSDLLDLVSELLENS